MNKPSRLCRHIEVLDRAFDATLAAIKETDRPMEFDSDEGLEAILRRELIEIAYFNGRPLGPLTACRKCTSAWVKS